MQTPRGTPLRNVRGSLNDLTDDVKPIARTDDQLARDRAQSEADRIAHEEEQRLAAYKWLQKLDQALQMAKVLNSLSGASPEAYINQVISDARVEARAKIETWRTRWLHKLEVLERQVKEVTDGLRTFRSHIRLELESARAEDRANYHREILWQAHQQAYLAHALTMIKSTTEEITRLQNQFLDLDFNLKYARWEAKKTKFQAEAAIHYRHLLKQENGLHDRVSEVVWRAPMLRLQTAMERYDAKQVKALALKTKMKTAWSIFLAFHDTQYNVETLERKAHEWRHWNLFGAIALRFPDIIPTTLPALRLEHLVENLSSNVEDVRHCVNNLDQLHQWQTIRKQLVFKEGRYDLSQAAGLRYRRVITFGRLRLYDSYFAIASTARAMIGDRSLLFNPLLKTDFWRRLFLVQYPLATYIQSTINLTHEMDVTVDVLRSLPSGTHHPLFDLIRNMRNEFRHVHTSSMRQYGMDLQISIAANAKIASSLPSQANLSVAKRILQQYKEAYHLSSLSGNVRMYAQTSTAPKIVAIEPMLRDFSLYPSTRPLNIEHPNTLHRTTEILEEMKQSSILGFDVLPTDNSKQPTVVLATVNRVVLIEKYAPQGHTDALNPVKALLQDHRIIKIIYDKAAVQQILAHQHINLESVIDVCLEKAESKPESKPNHSAQHKRPTTGIPWVVFGLYDRSIFANLAPRKYIHSKHEMFDHHHFGQSSLTYTRYCYAPSLQLV